MKQNINTFRDGKYNYLPPELCVLDISYESTIAASNWNDGKILDSEYEDLGNY